MTTNIHRSPQETARLDEPIDIIMTGLSTYIAALDDDCGRSLHSCDFIDCDYNVLVNQTQVNDAIDLMAYRGDDDCLLCCCTSHVDDINNSPSIVGPTMIRVARAAARVMFEDNLADDAKVVS